ncbi:hypothetical protein HPB51_002782 [Rhipicephalus microplus]|uniref:Uncharacterized protein n=1 Tax=Rhipicephalus microplus TaxID=6941 RepID=A0A9J6EWA3_RHIMP|nr:hypothetical protein HPB51_002782 [Rhipicephalus microplus]
MGIAKGLSRPTHFPSAAANERKMGGDEESALLPRGSLNAPFRLCRRDVEKASTTSFRLLIYFARRLGTPEGSAPPTPRQPTTERRKGRSSLHPLPKLLPPLRRRQCFRCSRRIKRTLFLCLYNYMGFPAPSTDAARSTGRHSSRRCGHFPVLPIFLLPSSNLLRPFSLVDGPRKTSLMQSFPPDFNAPPPLTLFHHGPLGGNSL